MKNKIVEVEYVSLWDGGLEVTTTAKYNIESGEVYDIETTDENIEILDILEREFIRLDNGNELDVSNESGVYRVINFAKILEALSGTDEAFVEDKDYPTFCDVLVDFADEHDVNLRDDDIILSDGLMDVDFDGFPYIKKDFKIPKFTCGGTIIGYHHNNWDFYIEDFELLKK